MSERRLVSDYTTEYSVFCHGIHTAKYITKVEYRTFCNDSVQHILFCLGLYLLFGALLVIKNESKIES